MQCNQPTPDGGVPADLSSPAWLKRHMDDAHLMLDVHGVPRCHESGIPWTLATRIQRGLRHAREQALLSCLDDDYSPATRRPPFDDDDPMLPATPADGARGPGLLVACVWAVYGALVVLLLGALLDEWWFA